MKKIYIISVLSLLVFSCSQMVEDLNQNPNNPTSAPYQYTLTGAEVATIVLQTGEPAREAGIFAGQFTGFDRQHLALNNYLVTSASFDNTWRVIFRDILRNIRVAEASAIESGIGGVTLGILQVLKALDLGTAASLFGDIPYDQAGSLEFENPEFESQIAVYGKIQTLLDDAIVNLATGTGRPPASTEIYFDGNAVAWSQVAYTLKARFFIHTKEYTAAYTAAQKGIGSNGSSHTNNMKSPHGTATDNANLHYQFFALASRKNDLVTSNFFASFIDSNNATNPIPANYRGNSKTNETARYNYLLQTTVVGIQPNFNTNGFAQIDAPAQIVTYAENLLILAEAGTRANFNTGLGHLNAFRTYMASGGYMKNPLMANVQYDPYVAADFDNLGIENPSGISSANALLREVLEERYITLFGQIEVFNDTRRTQNESIVRVPLVPNVGSDFPQRFLIGNSEIDTNNNTPNPIPGFFEPTQVNQ
jgi:hypothetical protein